MKFDPDKPHVKVRGMTGVRFVQGGHEFSSGYNYIGKVKGAVDPSAPTPDEEKESKEDIRARARAKIEAKRGNLDGFREKEAPSAIESLSKENEAARQAEEHAGD